MLRITKIFTNARYECVSGQNDDELIFTKPNPEIVNPSPLSPPMYSANDS